MQAALALGASCASFCLCQSLYLADNRDSFLHRRTRRLDAADIGIDPCFVHVVRAEGSTQIRVELYIRSAAYVYIMDTSTVEAQNVAGANVLDSGYTVMSVMSVEFLFPG